jgi:plasmid stabilization system protein ParE
MKRFNLVVESYAENDIEEAYKWYENQQIKLGKAFWEEVLSTLIKIQDNPFLFQKSYRNTRRAMVRKFPYGIYYTVSREEGLIQVIAVLHFKRSRRVITPRIH